MSLGRLAAVLAFVTTMMVCTPARAARTWLPPVQLAPPAAVSEGADVGMDAAGNALAAWVRAGVVQVATRPVGGAWSALGDLSTAGRNAKELQVKLNPRGDALVVWTEDAPDGRIVRYRSKPAGAAFGGQIALSEAGAAQPDVELNATGAAVATWLRDGVVEAATRAFADDRFGLPRPVSIAPDVSWASAGIDDAGRPTVVWSRFESGESRVEWSTFTAATWPPPATIPGSVGKYLHPEVAVHRSGRMVAMFYGQFASDIGPSIRVAGRASAAVGWEEATRLIYHEFLYGLQTRIDADGTPLFFVGGGRIANGWQLYGGPQGAITQLHGSDFIESPPWGTAVSPAGGSVLYWSGTGGRYQARYRPSGGVFGPIETIGGLGKNESGLALDDQGNGAFVWQDTSGAIWATGLDAAAPTITELSVPETVRLNEPATMHVAGTDRMTAVSASWRFSDDRAIDGTDVSRSFTLPGTYEVEAIVRDAAGNESRATRTITVPAPPPPPPLPAEPDNDGDGVRVSLDCDDGNPAIFPGALERLGNTIDENCDGRRDPYPVVAAAAQLTSDFQPDRSTRLLALKISDVAAGDTVRVTCRNKGCRKGLARTLAVTRDQRTLKLTKIAGARLRPKAVLAVTISHPERIARIFTFTMRSKANASGPLKVRTCQAPNQPRATPC